MAIAFVNSFAAQLLSAQHDFTNSTGDAFKVSLYTNGSVDNDTAAYTAAGEISGTGYTATGMALVSNGITGMTDTDPAFIDFQDVTWTNASFTAREQLGYNDTHASDAAVFWENFGEDKTVTSGSFTIQWPTADAANAIIRLGRA